LVRRRRIKFDAGVVALLQLAIIAGHHDAASNEIFLCVCASLPRFHHFHSFGTWLAMIIHRRKNRRPVPFQGGPIVGV
jgi:hypothetical protein